MEYNNECNVGLHMLLEAAELIRNENRNAEIGVICETPTVMNYEEVPTGFSMSESCSWNTSGRAYLSFANIVALTPIRESRNPATSSVLDLSSSYIEESPPSGNLSYKSNEPCNIDIFLNLAPVNRSEKTEPVRGNACVPFNLATTSRSASAQRVFHPPISDVYLRSPLSPLDMNNNKLQTGFSAGSLQAAYTPMDQEQLPVVNNQCQPGISSKKFKAVHSDNMYLRESTETSNEARQMIDEYFNSGGDDGNDYDHDPDNVGDATMLNEFSYEYFEVYRNDAFIGAKDEFTNEQADERVAHEAVIDPGFEELEKENVVNRPKSSYRKRMENKIR
ncbi:uncharacterized protein LOC129725593 [Wyeomyia smithii]|uniref:uncharacterized protein LOC129725593 n=1 Tax=Wyeomyia smithii TaxID=174621 RepID=UPI002467B34B|nr:uncharacterized protein LOC129725593 [Wyeomyia smithii]